MVFSVFSFPFHLLDKDMGIEIYFLPIVSVLRAYAFVFTHFAGTLIHIAGASVLLHTLLSQHFALRTVHDIGFRIPDEGIVLHCVIFFLIHQKSPVILPSSQTSIPSAAGTFGSPGIVIISPAYATMKPAPALTFIPLIVMRKEEGAPVFFGSSENEYWVFAMQTG